MIAPAKMSAKHCRQLASDKTTLDLTTEKQWFSSPSIKNTATIFIYQEAFTLANTTRAIFSEKKTPKQSLDYRAIQINPTVFNVLVYEHDSKVLLPYDSTVI